MNELGQGLTLSGIGILITFTALGFFIGLILLLKWFFPARTENTNLPQAGHEISTPQSMEREEIKKLAAAAGVATLIQAANRSAARNLGKLLEEPVSEWWKKGLDRVHGKE